MDKEKEQVNDEILIIDDIDEKAIKNEELISPNEGENEVMKEPNPEQNIDTVNRGAEIEDAKFNEPQTQKEENISIAQNVKGEKENKKSIAFIIILFVILVVFIIALPYINTMIEQITG